MKKETSESIFGKEFWIKIIRIILGGVLAALGYFLFNEENYGLAINLTINLIAWLILSYDVLLEAFEDVFKEHEFFSEDMLMIIATVGAFAIRAFGKNANEFVEGVMVMLLFQIGEMFEDIADAKSHKAISEAVGLRAPIAHKKVENGYSDIHPEELKIGDEVEVRVGEILPADGKISYGEGFLDMSSLTGEPVPIKKKGGDIVNAGTILKEGSIHVIVDREYQDNTVSKILHLIQEGQDSKSKATRFVDKFAKIYTPAVVLLALCFAVLPPLIINASDSKIWQDWIYRSLNLLIISCPCAIVISVPLTYFSGIGLASKNGIVIKGAAVFDQLSKLGYLVTDKTGTLTHGEFAITKIASDTLDEKTFLEYVKAAESKSNHPIASAINAYPEADYYVSGISDYQEIAGHGISLEYKGKKLLVGNAKLMNDNQVAFTPARDVGSVVYLAVDGIYQGYLVCSDTIREESRSLVDEMHQRKIKVIMLTGDKENSAKATSDTLGLDEYHAELLPQDKTALLKEKLAKKENKTVAYMGDGINDAASISMADVGIAMGGAGSELAIDNADVVIMNDNPQKVSLSLKIASLVRGHVLFNIIFSILVKITIMVLSVTIPSFPMLISVIADTGLTMVLIVISALMMKHRFGKPNAKSNTFSP